MNNNYSSERLLSSNSFSRFSLGTGRRNPNRGLVDVFQPCFYKQACGLLIIAMFQITTYVTIW